MDFSELGPLIEDSFLQRGQLQPSVGVGAVSALSFCWRKTPGVILIQFLVGSLTQATLRKPSVLDAASFQLLSLAKSIFHGLNCLGLDHLVVLLWPIHSIGSE